MVGKHAQQAPHGVGPHVESAGARGHDAVLQRLLPAVYDLQGLSGWELTVGVRACLDSPHQRVRQAGGGRAAGADSPPE